MNGRTQTRPRARCSVPARVLALAALAGVAPAQAPPTPVRVDEVRFEEVADLRRVTGDLHAARRARIAAQEAGWVEELAVQEGSRVETGEVIARLDPSKLELEVALLGARGKVAAARVEEQRADLRQAEGDLEILRDLSSQGAANPKELNDAETALSTARARLAGAEGEVLVLEAQGELLRDRIEDLVVRAPFGGFVIEPLTEVGEWLAVGHEVADLSADDLEAWLDVPQREFAATRAAVRPIRLVVDATGATLELSTYRTVGQVDPRARTFRLILPLPETDALAPGMSVSAWVPTGERRERPTVSRDAILRNEAGTFVYVAMGEGEGGTHAVPVPVEVEFETSDRAVLRPGALQPGAQVIVEGNERLFPMSPVQPSTRGVAEAEESGSR